MININGSRIFLERKQLFCFAPPKKKKEKRLQSNHKMLKFDCYPLLLLHTFPTSPKTSVNWTLDGLFSVSAIIFISFWEQSTFISGGKKGLKKQHPATLEQKKTFFFLQCLKIKSEKFSFVMRSFTIFFVSFFNMWRHAYQNKIKTVVIAVPKKLAHAKKGIDR